MDTSKYIIPLGLEISPKDQRDIINSAIRNGVIVHPGAEGIRPFWIAETLRSLDLMEQEKHLGPFERGRLSYLLRLGQDREWSWKSSEISECISKILFPLHPYIKRLNRVVTMLQLPGTSVPSHRDLIVGDHYDNMQSANSTRKGENSLIYRGDPWFDSLKEYNAVEGMHSKQGFFGIRIPLSESQQDNGKPFIESKDGVKKYYKVGSQLFLLNEAEVFHGAEAVNFHRGVVIADALLDFDKVMTRTKTNSCTNSPA